MWLHWTWRADSASFRHILDTIDVPLMGRDSTFYNVVHVILRFSNGQVGRLQAFVLPFVDPQYSMTITHGKKWVAWQDVWLVVALIVYGLRE